MPAPHTPARPSPATRRRAHAVTPQGPARKLLRARPPPRLAVRLRRARELGRAREARRADSRVSVASFRSRVTRRRPAGPSRAHPSFRGPLPRLERSTRHCARDLVTPGRGASQAPASQGSQPRGPGRLADPTGHGVRLAHPDARPFVGDRDQEEPRPAPAVCGCRPPPAPFTRPPPKWPPSRSGYVVSGKQVCSDPNLHFLALPADESRPPGSGSCSILGEHSSDSLAPSAGRRGAGSSLCHVATSGRCRRRSGACTASTGRRPARPRSAGRGPEGHTDSARLNSHGPVCWSMLRNLLTVCCRGGSKRFSDLAAPNDMADVKVG